MTTRLTAEERIHNTTSFRVDGTHVGRCVIACDDALVAIRDAERNVYEECKPCLRHDAECLVYLPEDDMARHCDCGLDDIRRRWEAEQEKPAEEETR
ncbi:hypothetical protein LCGC14_0220600 [marine sediment metagenome]|uniref:Uncharacterized protein n=1 Tax=marine sediment metagenome TaxID=412755 RepID=A0A0F9XGZ1_9ZZZZ